MSSKIDTLLVPSLRAEMGDWIYYISFLKMKDIAERVSIAEHIHSGTALNEWLQRRLSANARQISRYLLMQEQRFFNALVVGTYGGSPVWLEVAVKGRTKELPKELGGVLGFLELSGEEVLFAIDGQHRVEGIRLAIKEDQALKEEEVCTIFVKGVSASQRKNDPKGFQRTRRLFTTLNRYAKPVRKRDIIALDEDDIVAITTRRLLEEHELFAEKTALRATKPISPDNKTDFTTIVSLYDAQDIYYKGIAKILGVTQRWADYKKRRPSEADVDAFYQEGISLWEEFIEYFEPLKNIRKAGPTDQVAGRYRRRSGGHLLFRPVGLEITVRVITQFRKQGSDVAAAVARIARAPMMLEASPWHGLLWDSINARMLTAGENKKVSWQVLYHSVGGDLKAIGVEEENLRKELAGIQKKELHEITLPAY